MSETTVHAGDASTARLHRATAGLVRTVDAMRKLPSATPEQWAALITTLDTIVKELQEPPQGQRTPSIEGEHLIVDETHQVIHGNDHRFVRITVTADQDGPAPYDLGGKIADVIRANWPVPAGEKP